MRWAWSLGLLACGSSPQPGATVEPQLVCAAAPASREVVSPLASSLTADEQSAKKILETFLHEHGRDIGNPWALGHTLLALGGDVRLDDGRKAVDALFETYAIWDATGLTFPQRKGTIRVEPHTDLVLKALTETGLPPTYPVTAQGRSGTLSDLYCASQARSFVSDSAMSYHSNNDIPWSLQGLAAWTEPGATWRGEGGGEMSVGQLARRAAETYHAETEFIREARRLGGSFQKRKQGIFQYTCGGAHLLQGAAYAVARGHGQAEERALLSGAADNLLARYTVEQAAVEAALTAYPQYELKLRVQRLKFLGHFIETLHKLAAFGMVSDNPEVREALARARAELANTVQTISDKGWLSESLADIRAADEQAYLDLLGDAAHALRGLRLSTGEGTVLL